MSDGGVGLPPFTVRDITTLNTDLGDTPLPAGYIQVPLFNIAEETLRDDLDLDGCEYVDIVDSARFPADSTYSSVFYLVGDLAPAF